jgi:hypothetical protein
MTEYMVIESDNKRDIEEEVDNCLKAGWKLQGGVSFGIVTGGYGSIPRMYYIQAMIKTEELEVINA